jgi:SAM-dependent methyltransferase
MTTEAKTYYKDYWTGEAAERDRRSYYERLYGRIADKLRPAEAARVLDVAGGNGQFMRYLGVRDADIIDISESGIKAAARSGYRVHLGDIEARFPFEPGTFDAAYCFEVLEHLHRPNKTLAEIHNVLKSDGVLYVGQPNMRADGTHHVRRYYLKPLLSDLEKCGFCVQWIDYVPAYSMRDAILSDIRKNPSLLRKAIQCANLAFSFLPRAVRHRMARAVPDRFALLFVLKAVKK